MALPGFELLFSTARQDVNSNDAACVLALHYNLISHGFKCCGSGDTWPTEQQQSGNIVGSEFLPEGWSSDAPIYTLRYVDPTSNRTFLLKALSMNGQLNVNFVRCFDEKAASIVLRPRDFVNDNMATVASAYSNFREFNQKVTEDLVNRVVGVVGVGTETSGRNQRSASAPIAQGTQGPGPSPLMVDPPRGQGPMGPGFVPPPRHPFGGSLIEPFSVGRADLDPLARGGGGMIMDPRGFPSPPRPGMPGAPSPGMPGGLPLGAVPPGARFDPIGPHMGGRVGPDPDHERPPDGFDDMFM